MANRQSVPKIDYKKMFSVLPERYIVFAVDDPLFTILEENEAHAKVAMRRPQDVVGKPLLEAFPDVSDKYIETGVSDLVESLRRVIKTKQPDIMPHLKYDIPAKDGTFAQKYWSVQHHPVLDTKGDVVQIYQITKDITDEIETSRKLRETEQQLERALNVGKICTWNWDILAGRVFGDSNLAELFGCSEEDVRNGLTIEVFLESIHPDDQKMIRDKVENTLKDNVPYEAEYRTINRNGDIRWVIARGKLMRNDQGEPVAFPGAIIDITDRKITEKNLSYLVRASTVLASSLDYTKTLQEAARLAVPEIADWCTVDLVAEDGCLQQVALAHKEPEKVQWAKELRKRQGDRNISEEGGVPQVVRTGKPLLYSHIPDEMLVQSARDEEELQLLRSVGMSAAIIVPLKVKGKTIGAMTLISAEMMRHYTDADLQVAQEVAARAGLAVANATAYERSQKELAERKRLQKELSSLNDKLETRVKARTRQLEKTNLNLQQSNRELENFAYVASHDLQEPLRKIQAFGNLLEEEYGETLGEGQDYLRRMRGAAERMSALINDLLAFSRVTTKKEPLRRVNLNEIVSGVMGDLEDLVRRSDGNVVVSSLPEIVADATQMRQLFQNLIGNALKFRKKDIPPVVKVSAKEIDGGKIEIHVEDNGVGFDEQYLDKIFAVFQRLNGRDEYEGTGIGLAVCRKIAERHGGDITAKSSPGNGATFIVTLLNQQHKEGEKL